jgi:hypothetical protein
MSPLEFCRDFFPKWIKSLPQEESTPIMVEGKILTAHDLEYAPYFGQIFQAYCEGRLKKLLLEWARPVSTVAV